jgi:hypothetical protein
MPVKLFNYSSRVFLFFKETLQNLTVIDLYNFTLVIGNIALYNEYF